MVSIIVLQAVMYPLVDFANNSDLGFATNVHMEEWDKDVRVAFCMGNGQF